MFVYCFVKDLLPIEVDGELQGEGPKMTDTVKYASEEHKEAIAVRNIMISLLYIYCMKG